MPLVSEPEITAGGRRFSNQNPVFTTKCKIDWKFYPDNFLLLKNLSAIQSVSLKQARSWLSISRGALKKNLAKVRLLS